MKTFILIAIGLSTLLIGFLLNDPAPSDSSTAESSPPIATRSSNQRPSSSYGKKIAELGALTDNAERNLRWVALLENASLDDMIDLSKAAVKADHEVHMLIASHWMNLDPAHFFDASLAAAKEDEATGGSDGAAFHCYKFLRHLGAHWLDLDQEAAISAFFPQGEHLLLERGQEELINHLAVRDLPRAIALAEKNDVALDFGHYALAQIFKNQPETIATALLEYFQTPITNDDARSQPKKTFLLGSVAKSIAKRNPESLLQTLSQATTHEQRYLRDQIFEIWSQKHHERAGQWLMSQPDDLQDRYRPALLQSWAREDATGALQWTMDHLKDHPTLQNATEALFEGAAAGDPEHAAALLSKIEEPTSNPKLALVVAKQWFKPQSNGSIAPEAVNWLVSLPDPTQQARIADHVHRQWSKHDFNSYRAFVESQVDSNEALASVRRKAAEVLVGQNPIEALSWVATFAPDSIGYTYERWLKKHPQGALDHFQSLPPSHPQREAYLKEISHAARWEHSIAPIIRAAGLAP